MCNAMIGDAVAPQIILPEISAHLNELVPSDDFWQGTAWPIPELALAALVDLGVSDERIAHYFHIEPSNVQSLRLRFDVQRRPS